MEKKMVDELEQREVENRARKFLDEYRKLCAEYGMEFSVENPKFVIVEQSFEEETDEHTKTTETTKAKSTA